MRVLIISFFTDWVTHLGTELEIAQRHLDEGHSVHFLTCDRDIGCCRANTQGVLALCDQCVYRRVRGVQLLKGKIAEDRISAFLTDEDRRIATAEAVGVVTLQAAKDYRFEGNDLGWGAASSVIDVTRDPFGTDKRFAELLPKATKAAILCYLGVRKYLAKHGAFDEVYIFNGRFETTRAAVRACQKNCQDGVVLHERGSSVKKFVEFRDGPVHSRSLVVSRVNKLWEEEPDHEKRLAEGVKFFEDRRKGCPSDWISFVQKQDAKKLPDNFHSHKVKVGIFNSSEDEWAAVGDEWQGHIYPRQGLAIKRIVDEAAIVLPNVHFYLRMHPNLVGVRNDDTLLLRGLRSENLTLIDSDSDVSTYAILDNVDKVLTFGSTVGIEAAFWGKPSILASPAVYESLGSVYVARDHAHVMQMLKEELTPLPKEGAVKYGFYSATFGKEFRYWKANGFFKGNFRNVDIEPAGWRFAKLIENMGRTFPSQGFLMRAVMTGIEKASFVKKSVRRKGEDA